MALYLLISDYSRRAWKLKNYETKILQLNLWFESWAFSRATANNLEIDAVFI